MHGPKIPDSCDSRGFRRGSTVNSVIDAIGPIESVTSLRMQFPSMKSVCMCVRKNEENVLICLMNLFGWKKR